MSCNCGCGGCQTEIKAPILTEGRVKSLLSEGLKYHINNEIPLHETVYRYGSITHLSLIKEARKLYSRNVIDLNEYDTELIKTHLGEWGIYEGKSVPLDLPMMEEMDGGQLFDYFAKKGYKVEERRPDGKEAGFEGYMVSYGSGPYPQSVIFQYNKDTNEFMISRMGGYRIDQDQAAKSGMRQAGYSSIAGRDSYMTDGNYTPVDISAEGLKDIVDHVMTGLDRESKAQTDFYSTRGRTSGTIDEKMKPATWAGRAVVVHMNGPETEWKVEFVKSGKMVDYADAISNLKFDDDTHPTDYMQRRKAEKDYLEEEDQLDEKKKAKKKKKDPPIGKPKRGGSKAYYVYVRNPKTKKIKKVSFGSGGLRAKINNPKARKAFAARHKCSQKTDRTKASYWSCRLPRYAKALGLGNNKNTFW